MDTKSSAAASTSVPELRGSQQSSGEARSVASLADTLNEAFGRTKRATPQPKTRVVATYHGQEFVVAKNRNGLWQVTLDRNYSNSHLSDLIEQIEAKGAVVERRSL